MSANPVPSRNDAKKGVIPRRKSSPSRTATIMALGGYTSPRRVKRILSHFDRRIHDAECLLRYENPFQLLVGTVLSRNAQMTESTGLRLSFSGSIRRPRLLPLCGPKFWSRTFTRPASFAAKPETSSQRRRKSLTNSGARCRAPWSSY